MNRLILIGNGFDLAHGFKTGYKDFILSYFQNALKEFYSTKEYKDELFELCYDGAFTYDYKEDPKLPSSIVEMKSAIEDYLSPLSGTMVKVNVVFHSAFFKGIYNSCSDLGWVDIENEYFRCLLLLKNLNDEEGIRQLNKEFDVLTKKLEEYLIRLNINDRDYSESTFSRLFAEKIKKEDIVLSRLEKNIDPENICFLNFNYTSTIDNYYNYVSSYVREVGLSHIYIHGELDNLENPIIFGFGDELDKDYLDFENRKNNDLFRHIKSFRYSQTSNYHDLIRFVEADDFQVYIIGHSCGLSDRTMLNHIFEHERCKSIKVFYYKRSDETDDFTEKTYEISRHFKDKGMMRKKLVPKDKSEPLPRPRSLNK